MAGQKGILVVSLDFELYWGVRDIFSLDRYRENLVGERAVIPLLLELFSRYGIHSTWAVVGFLFYKSRSELINGLPVKRPGYIKSFLCPYRHIKNIGLNEEEDPFHYAFSLIEKIAVCPHQEVGSHTFSHYCCLERGQDAESFGEDIKAAVKAAKKFPSIDIKSIVFPQNQVNTRYLSLCAQNGIKSYRGTERSWYYKGVENRRYRSFLRRGLRLLDSYFIISGHNCYSIENIKRSFPYNIPSSRFLRPYSSNLRFLEPLRLKRILSDLNYAAEKGLIYHLWWHPHNFGADTKLNLAFLEAIFKHYLTLKDKYGMESLNMGELAENMEKTR